MRRAVLAAAAAALFAACSFDPAVRVSLNGDAGDIGDPDADIVHTYVSYWSFDVDATDEMGAHDGVLMGGAVISTGGQGYGGGEALLLAQAGDFVDTQNPMGFDFDSDFTWHMYIKTTDESGALFSRSPPAADWNQGSKALFVRSRSVQFDSYNVGNWDTNKDVDDEQWHQVIATFRASDDRFRMYVDPMAEDPMADYSSERDINRYDEHTHEHNGNMAGSGFSIGSGNSTGGLGSLDTLRGLIDEAAVFDRVIEGEELVQLITSGPRSF